MRVRSVLVAAGICGSLVLTALPASGAPPLRFSSPRQVTSGVAFDVASTDPCPSPPASAGTGTEIVEVVLALPNGEGGVAILTPNPDGSWSGSVTATYTSAPARGTVNAVCAVLDGSTGTATSYATYKGDGVKLG